MAPSLSNTAYSLAEYLRAVPPEVLECAVLGLNTDGSDETVLALSRHPALDEANALMKDALQVLEEGGPMAAQVAALLIRLCPKLAASLMPLPPSCGQAAQGRSR